MQKKKSSIYSLRPKTLWYFPICLHSSRHVNYSPILPPIHHFAEVWCFCQLPSKSMFITKIAQLVWRVWMVFSTLFCTWTLNFLKAKYFFLPFDIGFTGLHILKWIKSNDILAFHALPLICLLCCLPTTYSSHTSEGKSNPRKTNHLVLLRNSLQFIEIWTSITFKCLWR